MTFINRLILALISLCVAVSTIAVIHSSKSASVISVTNLEAGGPGSLRKCAEASGPRVCKFDVAGTIKLTSDIRIENPNIVISGETAPSPGITITGAGVIIKTHDVHISHIRVRPGDALTGPDPEDRDAFRVETGSYDVVLDHVSASFAVDENIGIWGENIRDITVSNSIISNGLDKSIHPKGPHSKGMLVGADSYPPQNISIVRNLFANNRSRNPLVNNGFIANNVIFGWDIMGTNVRGSTTPDMPHEASIIGNVYISTKRSSSPIYMERNLHKDSKVFVSDNILNRSIFKISQNFIFSNESPWIPYGYSMLPSNETLDYVVKNVGSRPDDRDAVDAKTIQDILDHMAGV